LNYQINVPQNNEHFEVKTEGKAEIDGFEAFLGEIFSHPKWAPGKALLIDHSDLVLRFFQTEEVRSVSKMVINQTDIIGKGKWAIVVTGNFAFGMARMWQIITEEKVPMEISVFKDREKAIKWLSNGKMEDK
jgi:hypothetical protein